MVSVGDRNGFRALKALAKAAQDERVDEIEGGGCDEGRALIHLKPGYVFSGYESRTKGVGSGEELRYALSIIERRA